MKKQSEDLPTAKEDIVLISDFYKCAFVGLILQWLDGGMKHDPEYIVDWIWTCLGGTCRTMLENAAEKTE